MDENNFPLFYEIKKNTENYDTSKINIDRISLFYEQNKDVKNFEIVMLIIIIFYMEEKKINDLKNVKILPYKGKYLVKSITKGTCFNISNLPSRLIHMIDYYIANL